MGDIKEWGLCVLNEHGMTKIEQLYSVTCNIRHIVEPFLGDEDLTTLASQHTDFMAQGRCQARLWVPTRVSFHFQGGGPQAASHEPSQVRYEACQAADFVYTVSLACIAVVAT